MTRILFLIPTLMHGGAEKVLVNLVNNLGVDKYDVTLYSIFDGGVNRQFLKKNIKYQSRFRKVFRGNSQLMKLFSPKWLYRFFITEDYDIVISFLEGPAARIISGCTKPNTKKVAWIHSDSTTKELASVGFRSFSEARKCYKKFDAIVAVSESVKQSFDRTLALPTPVQVLYNVNETENIQQLGNEDVQVVFPQNTVKICSVGKLSANKGFDRLLDAHYRLLAEGFHNHVYILGIGENHSMLTKQVKDWVWSKVLHCWDFMQTPTSI